MTSSESGNWRTDRVPYAREWMDSANCPWVRQVTICASTQVGKTETLNNVIGYAIDQDPAPIVFVMPRHEDAETVGEMRISPMVDESPALRAHKTDRKHDWNKRRVKFDRCVLYFRSAQSPMDLASVAARWLIGDECDKWPKWSGREAPPWSLALERQRTFYNSVAYLTSTPTTRNGLIWAEMNKGDRRKFYVPCPECDRFQAFRFKQVKWPKAIDTAAKMEKAREAHYECEHCAAELHDGVKTQMLASGRWVPEGSDPENPEPERNSHRSYHIWAAYSPWLSWWEIAEAFLSAKGNPGKMMNLTNSWFAEPWEEKVEDPKPSLVRACCGGYKLGTIPGKVKVITAGVDVQKAFIPYVVRGWGDDEESWLLARGRAENFEELADALCRTQYGPQPVRLALIDARYRTHEVLEFARANSHFVRMIYGVERSDPRPFSTSKMDRHPITGQPLPRAQMVWHLNVGFFKDLASLRILNGSGNGPQSFHLPEDVGETYVSEVSAEHKVIERSGSKMVERWIQKPGHRANHFWDCEIYNFAAGVLLRIHTLRGGENAPPRRAHRRPRDDDEDPEGPRKRLWRRS